MGDAAPGRKIPAKEIPWQGKGLGCLGDALFEAVQRQLTQHGDIARVRSGATPSIKTRRWLKSTPTISETCGRCCSGAGTLKQIEFALVNRVQVAPTFIFFNADGEPVT